MYPKDDAPESLYLSEEEKENAHGHLFAVIDSADPPSWAGLPMPEKKRPMRRFLDYLKEILF